jgi:hypothetical protein
MYMRGALDRLGFALCVLALAGCVVLHIATFFRAVSLIWIVPPFLVLAGAVLCSRAVAPRLRLSFRVNKMSLAGFGLLAYAIFWFVYFYKTTGGASSVGVVDGRYVSMYQGHVLRTITEKEYLTFPNLWTRVMSAWVGMMAVFCSKSFKLPSWFNKVAPSNDLTANRG